MEKIIDVFHYRTMIQSLIQRDLRGRYKGSVLGFAWTFLNPLLQLVVYTVVFSTIMRAGIEDYYLFLFVALIPWIFFSSSLTGGASCIISQKEMVKKIYFPREVLPIAHVTCQLVNMFFSFLVMIVVLLLSGRGLEPALMPYLLPVILVEYVLALGIAFITSSVTVYLRDLEHILVIIAMAWQFLSPVMYSIDMVPDKMRAVFFVNPMTSVIVAYRDILYYKRVPELGTLITATILGCGLLVTGWLLFGKLERHFAEEL